LGLPLIFCAVWLLLVLFGQELVLFGPVWPCLASTFLMASSGPASAPYAVTFTYIPLIPCELLTGTTNYSTWAIAVQLWFQGQGRGNHLATQVKDIPTSDQARWKQVDATLCSVLWFSHAPNLQPQFQAFPTMSIISTMSSPP